MKEIDVIILILIVVTAIQRILPLFIDIEISQKKEDIIKLISTGLFATFVFPDFISGSLNPLLYILTIIIMTASHLLAKNSLVTLISGTVSLLLFGIIN